MKKVLVVIAHADDEALGPGGTITQHVQRGDNVFILVLTNGESSRSNSADMELKRFNQFKESVNILGIKEYHYMDFDDNKLDSYPLLEVIQNIEIIKESFAPDIIYTHTSSDLNIDHQICNRAVLTAFRPTPDDTVSKILSFEVPSSTEWLPASLNSTFTPNYYIEISEAELENKIKALECYPNEIRDFPHPRSIEHVENLAKIRGSQSGVKLAEGFAVERIITRLS